MAHVLLFYVKALVYVAACLALGWLSATLARSRWPTLADSLTHAVVFLLGSGLLLVAAIGRLGWGIQTWGGDSPAERLDQRVFLVLSLLGTFLLVFEFFLGKSQR